MGRGPPPSTDPPAAFYRYTPTREGAHPQAHLKDFRGTLQADGYSGFDGLIRRGPGAPPPPKALPPPPPPPPLEIDNNAAERPPVLSRKNFLFAGADSGGERAAVLYTLLETAKLNGLDPEAYLRFVLERIAEQPSNRLAELLPWNFAPRRVEHEQLAA